MSVIETYTFTPNEDVKMPEFKTSMRSGSAYSEAAGGVSVETGGARVIQHSPNPR
jgi:hypothetical protein